jgi:hypothetical protein
MSDGIPIQVRFEALGDRWLNDVTELVTDPDPAQMTK